MLGRSRVDVRGWLTQAIERAGTYAMASVTVPNAKIRNLIVRQHYRIDPQCPLTPDGVDLEILNNFRTRSTSAGSPRRHTACLAPTSAKRARSSSPRNEHNWWAAPGSYDGWGPGSSDGWIEGSKVPTTAGDLQSCDDRRTDTPNVAHPKVRHGYLWPSTSHGRR